MTFVLNGGCLGLLFGLGSAECGEVNQSVTTKGRHTGKGCFMGGRVGGTLLKTNGWKPQKIGVLQLLGLKTVSFQESIGVLKSVYCFIQTPWVCPKKDVYCNFV